MEIINVTKIPIITTIITDIVAIKEELYIPKILLQNIVEIVIKKGNLPLHGTNTFVRIAISLSLGESIILQPVTPSCITTKTHTHG